MRKLWIALAITCGVLFVGGASWGGYSYYRLGKSKKIWSRSSSYRYGGYGRYGSYRRSSYGSRFAALIGRSFIRRWKSRTTVGFGVGGGALVFGVVFVVLAARTKRSGAGGGSPSNSVSYNYAQQGHVPQGQAQQGDAQHWQQQQAQQAWQQQQHAQQQGWQQQQHAQQARQQSHAQQQAWQHQQPQAGQAHAAPPAGPTHSA